MQSMILLSGFWAITVFILAPRLTGWLANQKSQFEGRLVERLEHFHIFIRVSSIRWVVLLITVLAFVISIFFLRSAWAAPMIMVAGLAAVVILVRFRLGRRHQAIRYQLPAVIELLSTSLRAGLSIRAALAQLVRQTSRPISQELAMLDRMQRIGLSLERAMAEWSGRLPIPELRLLTFTISVSAASGGGLSDALERLSGSFRQRLILEEKVDALTAQGKLQAWVMVALPMLLAGVLTMMDPESMASLWVTSTGHIVLAVVFILELIGLVWIRRLVRIQE